MKERTICTTLGDIHINFCVTDFNTLTIILRFMCKYVVVVALTCAEAAQNICPDDVTQICRCRPQFQIA